mmetsp:Transcript_44237/g.102195  ORF Transcript_44237/g.102195 Transcript_44237/m.102195 type:complete len:214 (+) Transcript_44237:559-1200(+)
MDYEDALSNDSAKRQVLEAPCDARKYISALVVPESLHACLLKTMCAHESVLRLILVIAPIEENLVWKRQLQRIDHQDGFHLVSTSVYPITIQDEVRSTRSRISIVVQVQEEVSKLSMEVTIDLCWGRASVHDGFLGHDTLQAYGQLLDERHLPALLTLTEQHLQNCFPCRTRPDVAHDIRLMRHSMRHMQGHLHDAIGQLVVSAWPCTSTTAC